MPIIDLPIPDLVQDSIERSRPRLDPERVSYYLEHLDESGPVVVFNVDGLLLLPMVTTALPQPKSLAGQR